MDGLFLNQKTNKNIRISYSLKYKHSKKNSLWKNKDEINIPGSSINQKPNSSKSVMLCTGAIPVQRYSHINGIIVVPFKSYLNQCFLVSQLLKCDGNVVVT